MDWMKYLVKFMITSFSYSFQLFIVGGMEAWAAYEVGTHILKTDDAQAYLQMTLYQNFFFSWKICKIFINIFHFNL